MRFGLLTGGGDCPGLNAAIRAVVRVATSGGDEVVGFHHGWKGVVEGDGALLTRAETQGILQSGGTILRTARFHPDDHEGASEAVVATVERERLDALIVLGGDGTLGAAVALARLGVPIVGIPKTIDNDVCGANRCIGFDTAVTTAAEAIDRVHTTGESHDRVMVVEVMGRHTGWLAVSAGIASGADVICLPEEPIQLDRIAAAIVERHDSGSNSSVVVVAEGCEAEGIGAGAISMGAVVADGLASRTGYETRLTVLGHIQRGGSPTVFDRLIATNAGARAVDAVREGALCTLVAMDEQRAELVSLDLVLGGARPVPPSLLAVAHALTVA